MHKKSTLKTTTSHPDIFSVIKTGYMRGLDREALERLLGSNQIINLLLHIPNYFISRALLTSLDKEYISSFVALEIKVLSHRKAFRRGLPHVVRVLCGEDKLNITFFNYNFPMLEKILPKGEVKVISGKLGFYKGSYQIANPDHIIEKQNYYKIKSEPVYSLTSGITNRELNKLVALNIEKVSEVPEWLENSFLKKQDYESFVKTLKKLHIPQNDEEIDAREFYVSRIAYDELLASQLAIQLMRMRNKQIPGVALQIDSKLVEDFIAKIPFELTDCQQQAIDEITESQTSMRRMTRMLQGDVGAGKTLVAIAAMINAVSAGKQACIMAPTAILAEQHYKNIKDLVKDLDIKVVLLKGDLKDSSKDLIKHEIKTHKADIVIGTHALFYDKVKFKDLGLAIIDEQHRFGVNQRAALADKGFNCDMLLMSATPIPRSLALTLYGDMEISFLRSKPKGRKEIITRAIANSRKADILENLKKALENNEKAYWICPLVTESEEIDLAAAEDRFREFKEYFGDDKIALVHGKMKNDKKDREFKKFKEGKVKILVATTVVEVGVDVPDATIIIIEQAERFGLAQLHQLRGRVGRGDLQSKCVLLYDARKISEYSQKRLDVMRTSNDGFYIAEQDLKLRGAGEIVGTKQSGLPSFKIANFKDHYDLLKIAHQDAKFQVEKDPFLESERGRSLQLLLRIFDYDLSECLKKIS